MINGSLLNLKAKHDVVNYLCIYAGRHTASPSTYGSPKLSQPPAKQLSLVSLHFSNLLGQQLHKVARL